MTRLISILLLCLLPAVVVAETLDVVVADPFIELRTGPGRGYPVTLVVRRGEQVTILKRRTDWFKVRDARGREGWVRRDDLVMTLVPGSGPLRIREAPKDEFGQYRGEAGILAGELDSEHVVTLYGSYAMNPHLAGELKLSQVMARDFDAESMTLALTHVFRPDWRFRPFISVGASLFRIKQEDPLEKGRTEQAAYVGAGVKATLSRRLVFRAEYNDYVVFTERDDNEEFTEWKLGFAFSF